jgi:phage shock protein C
MKKLYRSTQNKWIAGVCGGLGEYFKIDPKWIRVGFVAGLPIPFFPSIPIYLLCWLLITENPVTKKRVDPEKGNVVDVTPIEKK